MSREIHVTRGAGFGDAGAEPLRQTDWDTTLASFATIVVRKPGSRLGRIEGCPIVFNEGVIALTAPSEPSVETLLAIAKALDARLFTADGLELRADERRPGAFVIRACTDCGAKNRLPFFSPVDKRPKCGRCKKAL